MTRKSMILLAGAALVALAFFAACGGGGGGGGTKLTVDGPGLASFAQNIPAPAGSAGWQGEIFPGSANIWDITDNFSLEDGHADQFDDALVMTIGATAFPSDQTYAELTYGTPVAGAGSGLASAVVSDSSFIHKGSSPYGVAPLGGTYSAYLGFLPEATVSQAVNLAAASGTVTLSWASAWKLYNQMSNDVYFRVLLRSPSTGAWLATVAESTGSGSGTRSADLTAFAGQTVVLSFESRTDRQGYYYGETTVIDNVSVRDANGTGAEFVANGDFETGDLADWTAGPVRQPRTITSGARSAAGLSVTRSFYAPVGTTWARWTDTLTNHSAAAVAVTVQYYTNLGSDSYGVIYQAPGTGGVADTSWDGARAVTSWDASGGGAANSGDRDVGLVFGNAARVTFTSVSAMGAGNGSDAIYAYHRVTVPPGGSASIVQFVILSPFATEWTATDITARATLVDEAAKAIVEGFWTDPQYSGHLPQAQIDSIANWP